MTNTVRPEINVARPTTRTKYNANRNSRRDRDRDGVNAPADIQPAVV